ncbi:MAG TPA: ATP-binding protein [Kosmotogaceae bacterium]|nr:ATP-binding protein [Kosmotogaceae bacterium]
MNREDQKHDLEEQSENLAGITHRILVMSGKGGVGKSTVAVNLACALVDEGFKVGVLDIDIHGPNVSKMIGQKKRPMVVEEQILPAEVMPNMKSISIADFTNLDSPIVWRGPLKANAIRQLVNQTSWGQLDFLIVDAPPGTGDEPLTVSQIITGLRSIVVTTPQEVAKVDVIRALNFVQKLGVAPIGLVENMSHMKCPECGKIISLFGGNAGEDLSRSFSIPLLARIPFDPQVAILADEGRTISSYMRGSELEKAYRSLSSRVQEELMSQ